MTQPAVPLPASLSRKRRRRGPLGMILSLGLFLSLSLAGHAAPPESAEQQLTTLAWLSGHWTGNGFEAFYTTPAGGMTIGASKQLEKGVVTFFELERFHIEKGQVVLVPYPWGKKSDSFVLTDYRPGITKAVFTNPAHDFPQRISYERLAPDQLVITVAGPMDGKWTEEVFTLKRQGAR